PVTPIGRKWRHKAEVGREILGRDEARVARYNADMLALAVQLSDHQDAIAAGGRVSSMAPGRDCRGDRGVRMGAVAAYEAIMAQAHIIDASVLEGCGDGGKGVCTLLGIKPGRVISDILSDVMRWQLAHPDRTVECAEFVKEWNKRVSGSAAKGKVGHW
ncbi:hypothetical protein BC938DRAFT_476383, partial [Jimgerdemannia flammicorona]